MGLLLSGGFGWSLLLVSTVRTNVIKYCDYILNSHTNYSILKRRIFQQFYLAGSNILIAREAIQLSADNFHDPLKFNPDRFSPGTKIKPYTYFPFHAGPRMCIGKHFAMMGIKIVVSMLLKNVKLFDPYPEQRTLETKAAITLKPRNGVHVVVVVN